MDRFGVAADPYMTLVGYFNSLRELGGMRRLAEDDVQTRAQLKTVTNFEAQAAKVAISDRAWKVGRDAEKSLPSCRGRHPHLNSYDECCKEKPRAVLLGSTNSWFSLTLSVLAIPQSENQLAQLLNDGWTYFSDAESELEVKAVVKTLVKSAALPGIEKYTSGDIWHGIQAKQRGEDLSAHEETDIKRPEWRVPDCKGTLRFFEQGASLQTENLWVKCDGCGAPARSLVQAFWK